MRSAVVRELHSKIVAVRAQDAGRAVSRLIAMCRLRHQAHLFRSPNLTWCLVAVPVAQLGRAAHHLEHLAKRQMV